MRRRRFQKGSLQLRKHGNRRVWVVLYYDEKGERRYHTLGLASEMKKGEANEKRQEYMREINGGDRTVGPDSPADNAGIHRSGLFAVLPGQMEGINGWHHGKPDSAITSERRSEGALGGFDAWHRCSNSLSERRRPACHSASWITSDGTSPRCSNWRSPKR